MDETNDPYAVALLTIIFRSSTDYNFCGRGAVRECAQRCHDFSRVISPRDLTDLQSNRTISNHFFSQIFRRGTFQWRKITIRYKSLIVLSIYRSPAYARLYISTRELSGVQYVSSMRNNRAAEASSLDALFPVLNKPQG